jgi:hypothetical protein
MTVAQRPLIGIFDNYNAADNAIAQLHDAGFANDQIFHSRGPSEHGGFMEKLKDFFSGRQQSASPSEVASDLSAMGISDDEANYYAQEYQAGHAIVAVQPGGRYRDAADILRSNGAYNSYQPEDRNMGSTPTPYNEVAGTPPAPGYDQIVNTPATAGNEQPIGTPLAPEYQPPVGPAPTAGHEQPVGTPPIPTNEQVAAEGEEARRIKLREERLGVEKERVQTGEVRLRKEVVEEQQNIVVPVTHEEVVIERYPASEGTASDTPIGPAETIRIPEVQETQPISETVRHERVRMEQEGHPEIRGDLDPNKPIDPNVTP